MSSNALPEELLLQILIRLPPKSLIRFRSVCKFWHSFICSSNFISSHIHHNNACATNYFLLLRELCPGQEREIYSLHDESDNYKMIGGFVCPFEPQTNEPYFRIVGCVHGLICLSNLSTEHNLNSSVILWNPAIRKYLSLPYVANHVRPVDRVFPWQRLSIGFGYDAFSNDYKLLKLSYFFSSLLPWSAPVCSLVAADVFSLKNRSWRSVNNSVPNIAHLASSSLYLNGALHWLVQKEAYINRYALLTFDFNTEVFGEMGCPRDVDLSLCLTDTIEVARGCLSLLHEWEEGQYHIWVMKEYGVTESWTHVFSIDLDVYPEGKSILGFSASGELVLVGNGHYVGYDRSESLQIVECELPENHSGAHVELYMESLLLLDGEDDDSTLLERTESTDGNN